MSDKNRPQAPRPSNHSNPPKAGASSINPKSNSAPDPAVAQLAAFEAAMKLFHTRQFIEARTLFKQAATGAGSDVAQRARLHVAMCDRRLPQAAIAYGTAEECYNYGIALINARNVVEARLQLEKALSLAPGSDHIHYALALALALAGDHAAAHDNLRRAIELEPRNRQLARQDADFAPLVNHSAIRSLLYPEKAW